MRVHALTYLFMPKRKRLSAATVRYIIHSFADLLTFLVDAAAPPVVGEGVRKYIPKIRIVKRIFCTHWMRHNSYKRWLCDVRFQYGIDWKPTKSTEFGKPNMLTVPPNLIAISNIAKCHSFVFMGDNRRHYCNVLLDEFMQPKPKITVIGRHVISIHTFRLLFFVLKEVFVTHCSSCAQTLSKWIQISGPLVRIFFLSILGGTETLASAFTSKTGWHI